MDVRTWHATQIRIISKTRLVVGRVILQPSLTKRNVKYLEH